MASGASGRPSAALDKAASEAARQRRISSLLVESTCGNTSTEKPGSWGTTACQMASAGQRMGACKGWVVVFTQLPQPFLAFAFFSLGASSVPRQFGAPHQHGYSALSFLVYGASMMRP